METPVKHVPEKSRNPGSGKSRRPILPPSYPSPNRKSVSSGSDPIRFIFYTNKKQVSLGEEVELTITAHYMAMHPGLLATFPGSNAFSLKVIVPDGFIQTGGDYVDLIGTELSTHRKTVTYSLKGKFVSISSNHTFRLLRSHKDAGADSKFIEKGKFQIHCQNSAESLANAGSSKGSRIAAAEVACTPFSAVCSGNNSEIRNQTITVAQSGTYSLDVTYRSHEKTANGIMRIDGVAHNVTFAMTTSYITQAVGTVSLSAGTHTIGLSSGTEGGLVCFNNICLTNTTNTCSYTPSATVNNANPGCGTSINLSATCEGNDCVGVSYSWSGNGVNQHGQTISVNTPTSDGSYTYTVTASKSGCSKTSQTAVTVNGCGAGSLTGCYVIRSKKTGQLLQSLSGDVVEQRVANSQANQIWKAESVGTNQYRFITQDGSGKSMQVNAASNGELIRVETYTGTDLQKWVLQSDNNGSYRINTSNGLTWDMRNYGVEPQLQLWGNLTEGFADQRLFGFESVGCPTAPPATGSCTTLRSADSPANLTGGLTYKYYQSIANNDWCSATGLSSQAVVSSGSVGTVSLTPRQRDDHFGFEFTGYIQVPADGQYTFFITSDDDSQLLIGGQLIAADRGCHGINSTGQEPSGSICLRAGYHPIQILYSQGTEGLGLKTFWQGPTFAKQEIPAGALFRSGTPTTVACNFVVSATAPATANCSSAITLNAPCTGIDCDGVNYQWSTGQNGQSVNTTAAGNNGTTTYAVTASKAGCDNKIAQTSVSVNGCGSSLTGCYVIRSKKTGQLLQSLSGDVVEQRVANGQANQIWKAESVGTNQYRFTTQDGSDKSMQVNAASQGELLRIGTHTGTDLQKWTLQSDNNGSYRINTSNGLTWDMRNYGVEPQLQLWGNLTEGFADQRLFGFESTGCPTTPPATGSCTTLRNADSPANLTGGLMYMYYQSIANNDWCSATGLSNQAVVSSGSVSTISLTPRQRDDHFGFEFAGYIQVPADGQYTFFLNSDDESRLSIGGQLIIAHSGCHGTAKAGQEPSGSICLRAGYHPIQILYSQGDGGFGFQTFWQGPTFAKQEIPAGALSRSGSGIIACDFVVSATAPTTANCSSAITLNAPCTGIDCDGVSYQWSTGQNGQSINTTVPSSNGTSTYTVTVSKNGCNSETANISVTIIGCTTLSFQDMGRAGTRRDQFDIAKSNDQNGTIGISDISNYSVSGYNSLYFINDVYVGKSLNNYQLPVNAKYIVDKLITKSDITNGYQRVDDLWKQNSQDSQWINSWHQQIIDTYDGSMTIGDQTVSGGKGKLLPLYESWFIRSNNWNSEFLRSTSPLALPPGKIFGGDPLDATANLDDYRSHGWNVFHRSHINGQDIPLSERLVMPNSDNFKQGLQNSSIPNKNYSNGNPTYEQGVASQDYAGIDGFGWLIDQVGEGNNFVLGNSAGYLGYHERYKTRNPNSHTFGNYSSNSFRYRAFSYNFQPLGGGSRNPLNFNNYLRPYQSQQQARTGVNGNADPFYSDHGGKSLSSIGVEQLLNFYPFDVNDIDITYVKLHEMDIMLKQDPNNKPIGYFWPLRENPAGSSGGDASSGQNSYEWEHETTNPIGKVRQKSHSICSLIAAEVFAFDMITRGKGLVYFHNLPLTGNDRNKIGSSEFYPTTWIPNPGSTNNFPFVTSSEGIVPLSPLVGFDASYHGRIKAQRALNWLETTTPNWEYATYTLNGSTRTAPTDGSAILQHASDYKPMAMILHNGNKKVVWAFDPYCQPNSTQTINVNLNDGSSVDIILKGNALHVVLIN